MHADKSDEANAREDGQTKIGKKGSGSRGSSAFIVARFKERALQLHNFTTLHT